MPILFPQMESIGYSFSKILIWQVIDCNKKPAISNNEKAYKNTVCIHSHSIWTSRNHVKFYSCFSRLSDGLSSLDESTNDKLVEYKKQIAKLEQEQYEWQARQKELLSKQPAAKGS